MAVSVGGRVRMFWGAFDFAAHYSQAPAYTATQTVSGGPSALPPTGIGVRKCQITILRNPGGVLIDPAVMHFSFLNMTAGAPDDTWTTGDYTTLEGFISTWATAMKPYMAGSAMFSEYRWYRAGAGVVAPNPPERINILGTPIQGTVTSNFQLAQAACSITFRTGSRRHWGRTYLPYAKPTDLSLRPTNADVDAITTATNALLSSAAGADFHLVVVANSITSSLNVEQVEVDNVLDVIRRRRLKQTTYRKVLP